MKRKPPPPPTTPLVTRMHATLDVLSLDVARMRKLEREQAEVYVANFRVLIDRHRYSNPDSRRRVIAAHVGKPIARRRTSKRRKVHLV